jgi:hypothetical protein
MPKSDVFEAVFNSRDASLDEGFLEAWKQMETDGVQYSQSNVNKVHMGWVMAQVVARTLKAQEPPADVAGLVEQLAAEPKWGCDEPETIPEWRNGFNAAREHFQPLSTLIAHQSAQLAEAAKVIGEIREATKYVENSYAKEANRLATAWLARQEKK